MGTGGDPLGGNFEELSVNLKLRVDQFKQELQTTMDQTKETLQSLDEDVKNSEEVMKHAGSTGAFSFAAIVGIVSELSEKIIDLAAEGAKMVYEFVAGGVEINANLQYMQIGFTNMLGSEEKAVALIQELRKDAATIGADAEQFTQLGKNLLPFAEGDINKFRDMIELAQQLYILKPQAGLDQVNRAIRQAINGNIRLMANLFDIPAAKLRDFQKEFKKTGDVDAFIKSIQDVVGTLGVGKDRVSQLANTFQGTMRQMQFQFEELQRIMGAPLFESLQKHLIEFSQLFGKDFGNAEKIALHLGAILATAMDTLFDAIKTVINAINIATGLADQVGIIWNAMLEIAEEGTGRFVAFLVQSVVTGINSILNVYNSVAEKLHAKPVELIKFDSTKFANDITNGMKLGLDVMKANQDAIKKLGFDPLGNFNKGVAAYEEKFKNLLNDQEVNLNQMSSTDQQFTEEDLKTWQDALNKIGDAIEKYDKEVTKAAQDHEDKLKKIAADADKARKDAEAKAGKDVSKENASLKQQELAITKKYNDSIEQIEQDHADKIKQIKMDAANQLFDAVNARDAKRVYEIMNHANQETQNANAEEKKKLAQADKTRKDDLKNLQDSHKQRLKEIQDSLNEELQKIDDNEQQKKDDEDSSYRKRLDDLKQSLQDQLKTIGKGLQDEGKITADGLKSILGIVSSVYGPSGSYLALIDGFNQELAKQAQETQAILASMGQAPPTPTFSNSPTDPFTDPNTIINIGTPIPVATGFEGVVKKPTLFLAGEGGSPERVSVVPQGKPGFAQQGAGGSTGGITEVHVTVDATGVSAEFEAQVAAGVANIVGEAVTRNNRLRGR